MQSGKPSVQHLQRFMQDVTTAFDYRAKMGQAGDREEPMPDSNGEGDPELGGQIVNQLRYAYDELLDEPIPDHLLKLLEKLSDPEGKS